MKNIECKFRVNSSRYEYGKIQRRSGKKEN